MKKIPEPTYGCIGRESADQGFPPTVVVPKRTRDGNDTEVAVQLKIVQFTVPKWWHKTREVSAERKSQERSASLTVL